MCDAIEDQIIQILGNFAVIGTEGNHAGGPHKLPQGLRSPLLQWAEQIEGRCHCPWKADPMLCVDCSRPLRKHGRGRIPLIDKWFGTPTLAWMRFSKESTVLGGSSYTVLPSLCFLLNHGPTFRSEAVLACSFSLPLHKCFSRCICCLCNSVFLSAFWRTHTGTMVLLGPQAKLYSMYRNKFLLHVPASITMKKIQPRARNRTWEVRLPPRCVGWAESWEETFLPSISGDKESVLSELWGMTDWGFVVMC